MSARSNVDTFVWQGRATMFCMCRIVLFDVSRLFGPMSNRRLESMESSPSGIKRDDQGGTFTTGSRTALSAEKAVKRFSTHTTVQLEPCYNPGHLDPPKSQRKKVQWNVDTYI